MPKVRLAVAVLLLVATAVLTWLAAGRIEERRRFRTDLAELQHVRYGMLNADRWVESIVPIVQAKIEVFDLRKNDRASLKRNVEGMLGKLIDDVRQTIRDNNMKQGAAGKMRQALMDKFVNFDDIRRQVPKYADGVMARLETPEAKATLRQYLTGVVMRAANGTGGTVDFSGYNDVLKRYGCEDGPDCQQRLRTRLRGQFDMYFSIAALIAAALAFAVVWPGRSRAGIWILLGVCVALLLGGVTTPMIEIEAKISKLTLRLLDHPIAFSDQVLYFQTKSVWEVVTLMFEAGGFWTPFVGILVMLFSVVFPTLKLLSSAIYTNFDVRGWNRFALAVIRFFVFKSSKWSMADVMVVALFMAYIGFDRVLENSLSGLASTGADVITTTGSSLQPGYFLFIGFCLASLFLSSMLDRRAGKLADQ
jgi:hypothetical protein